MDFKRFAYSGHSFHNLFWIPFFWFEYIGFCNGGFRFRFAFISLSSTNISRSYQIYGVDQMEAGLSLGLSRFKTLILVILPQAVRISLPGFTNEFTIVLKDSPMAYALGIAELLKQGRNIIVGSFKPFTVYLTCAIIYFILFEVFYFLFKKFFFLLLFSFRFILATLLPHRTDLKVKFPII